MKLKIVPLCKECILDGTIDRYKKRILVLQVKNYKECMNHNIDKHNERWDKLREVEI